MFDVADGLTARQLQLYQVPKPTFTPRKGIQEQALNVTSDVLPVSCQSTITPACLQALYGIPSAPAQVGSNTLGVSGFDEQFANERDLQVSGVLVTTLRTHAE